MAESEPSVRPAIPEPPRSATAEQAPAIVDWSRTARRLRTVLAIIGGGVLGTWLVLGMLGGGFDPRRLTELLGIGLLLGFAVEVVVVGGVALRALLTVGERGERLASEDVFLLPPQLLRRRRPGDGTDAG